MRFSRLKKNIESKLDGGIKTAKPQKSKPSAATSKKRKISSDDDDDSSLSESEGHIGDFKIKAEGDQDLLQTKPRTRGKKIDVKDAFESDGSNAGGGRLHNESSDEYKMEDISEDKEEFQIDNDGDDEPVSKRRKSTSQSFGRKRSTTKIIVSKLTPAPRKTSSTIERPVLVEQVKKTAKFINWPTTPDPKSFVKEEKVAWGAKLPPTPQSRLSLLDMIDEKVGRAEYKLGFGSPRNNTGHARSLSVSPKTTSTTILPSIEHDDDDEGEAMSDARISTTSIVSVPSIHQQEATHSIPGALQTEPLLPPQQAVSTAESCVVQ